MRLAFVESVNTNVHAVTKLVDALLPSLDALGFELVESRVLGVDYTLEPIYGILVDLLLCPTFFVGSATHCNLGVLGGLFSV